MTLPRATMRSLGGGAAEGVLEGHPVRSIVRTMRLTDTEMTVGMWDGPHLVGNGLLRLADGVWRGTCTEFAGTWHIEAKQGSQTLEFKERLSRSEHALAPAGEVVVV